MIRNMVIDLILIFTGMFVALFSLAGMTWLNRKWAKVIICIHCGTVLQKDDVTHWRECNKHPAHGLVIAVKMTPVSPDGRDSTVKMFAEDWELIRKEAGC